MSVYVSLIVALIAGVLYLLLPTAPPLGTREKSAELCRILFFAGSFAFLLIVGGHITNLFGK